MSLFWLVPVALCLVAISHCRTLLGGLGAANHQKNKIKSPDNLNAIKDQAVALKKNYSFKPGALKKLPVPGFTFKNIITSRQFMKFNRAMICFTLKKPEALC